MVYKAPIVALIFILGELNVILKHDLDSVTWLLRSDEQKEIWIRYSFNMNFNLEIKGFNNKTKHGFIGKFNQCIPLTEL